VSDEKKSKISRRVTIGVYPNALKLALRLLLQLRLRYLCPSDDKHS